MHNLGLGGLDFNPDHTIEEHHPEGYKIYEDDNEKTPPVEMDLDGHHTEIRLKPTTDKAHKEKQVLEIKIDDDKDEEIVVVKEVHPHRETSREEDEVIYNRPDYNFKEMHDPKHRHPRYYGKNYNYDTC